MGITDSIYQQDEKTALAVKLLGHSGSHRLGRPLALGGPMEP
jgi:hypothetical protein